MDSNQTKFHLLLDKPDWGRATPGASEWVRRTNRPIDSLIKLWNRSDEDAESTGLRWNRECYELTLAPKLFQFEPSTKDTAPRLRDRRGAGRDRYGNWYWIAEDEQEILVHSAGSATTTHFWSSAADCAGRSPESRFGEFAAVEPVSAPVNLKLRGLAVTDDHYLVVGVLEPAGLLIFDLHAGGGPAQMIWPSEVEFTPFDFAPRPGGGVLILDRDPGDILKGTRYWMLDRFFNVEARNQSQIELNAGRVEDFQPLMGEPRRHQARMFPRGITLDSASPVAALDAISIEALPDQTALILDRDDGSGFSQIYRYGFEGQLGEPMSTSVIKALISDDKQRQKFKLIAHDFAFVPEHESNGKTIPDRLYVVEEKGNQSFAFNISLLDGQLDLEPLQAYLPMRLFGGKGLVASSEQPWYDFSDRWIPLVEQPRPRFETTATLETPEFDGAEPDCKWHRLMIDGRIPPESNVEVWTRASNDKQDLPFTQWQQEPGLYRRRDGSELPFAISRVAMETPEINDFGTWELLFQRARGRFLQIKLRLSGNGRTTPRLRALRAYYPRFSYLDNYLPAVYREDSQSASFLDRFLANIEGFYTTIEDKIAAVQVLFDYRSAPSEYLDWLAGWFGIVLDPSWGDMKRRLFIRHAMEFFQYRGTIHGLKAALRLAMEDCADESVFDVARSFDHQRDSIRIIENYRTRRTPGSVLGDPTSVGAQPPGELPQALQTSKWLPANGRADLFTRYSEYLSTRFGAELPGVVQFSLRNYDWQFPKSGLGPSAALAVPIDSNDAPLWRAFLKTRYVTIQSLNLAHGTTFSGFNQVSVPSSVFPASIVLEDWKAFVAEKTVAWRDFAQQSVGFVPRALGSERTRWRDFLASRYPNVGALNDAYDASYTQFENVPLPSDSPQNEAAADDWDDYQRATAGSAGAAMRTRWRDFLARRYRRIRALNDAWNTSWLGFDSVSLLDELPLSVSALADWHQFESVVLTMEASAHRFTVLLPAPKKRMQTEFQQRRDLAARIAAWEKPAHTVFDVKFYWAMFRVGSARLNYDTLLDIGSRAPELLSPMVLGQGYLAESYLTDHRDMSGRMVIGKDLLEDRSRS